MDSFGAGVAPSYRVAVSAAGVAKVGGTEVAMRMPAVLPRAGAAWVPEATAEAWKDYGAPLPLVDARAKPGDAWPVRKAPAPVTTSTAAAPGRVTVPAGTFDAFVVDTVMTVTKNRVIRYRHWYVRGVGEVKRTIDDGKTVREVMMTAFTPAK
jgi:hypothetical protein